MSTFDQDADHEEFETYLDVRSRNWATILALLAVALGCIAWGSL